MRRECLQTFEAGAAVSARRIAKFDANANIVQGAAATDLLIGVIDQAAVLNQRVEVNLTGQPEVEAGAAIAAGASITSDAQGRAVAAAAGQVAIGFAIVAADAAGDIIDIELGRHTAA
ncbi:MAG: capsid cement protein [Pseudomonadota bacterium]